MQSIKEILTALDFTQEICPTCDEPVFESDAAATTWYLLYPRKLEVECHNCGAVCKAVYGGEVDETRGMR